MPSLLDRAYPQKPLWVPPTQEELEAKALLFVKQNKHSEYLEAKQSGDLQEWLGAKARSAQSLAESFLKAGDPPEVAWNRAVRWGILEQEGQ